MTETDQPVAWMSHLHPEHTGAGLVQHCLAKGLVERGFRIETRPQPDGFDSRTWRRLRGLVAENIDAARHRTSPSLIAATPAPWLVSERSLLLVYDLRWMQTRSGWARSYRAADLRRAAHRSSRVCTALPSVAREVAAVLGRDVDVIPFGPGRATDWSFVEGNGDVLLIGAAAHKCNDVAAALLCRHPDWFRNVVTIGVAAEVRDRLDRGLGNARTEHHGRVPDAIFRQLMERSSFFVHLGRNEGFGFPYLEAIAAGCQVIAQRYGVTDDLLGGAALLADADPDELFRSLQVGTTSWPTVDVRRSCLDRYSWDACYDRFAELLGGL